MKDAKDILNPQRYSRIKYTLSISETITCMLFFLALLTAGYSSRLAGFAVNVTGNDYLGALLFMVVVGILLEVVTFPFDYLSSFRVEHDFALSNQNFTSWLKDYVKKLLVGGIFSLLSVIILYYFLRNSQNLWWLYVALIYFFISVVLAKIFPVLIIPLFYKLTRISDTGLKQRLLSLAQRAGVSILDIYNIGLGEKTKKANAAVCGLGSTKRILLSDTLIQKYTTGEIESALAHELSHHKHHHFWKLSFLNFCSMLIGLGLISRLLRGSVESGYIESIFHLNALIFIALCYIAYGILSLPVLNLISRIYEAEADRDAVMLTGDPEAFADLMNKLTLQNLSDPSPPPIIKIFFYSQVYLLYSGVKFSGKSLRRVLPYP